ncbi:MAG: serine/threonine-protein phosphatase [Ruminococcus sp.]|nr:serine/threonine-protein phosphatase [Ruminococcus sp.]
MVFTLYASCGSFIGNAHNNNEDNFYFNKKHLPIPNRGLKNPLKFKGVTEDPIVFALFDGMGGECKGEEASCLASEVFSKEFKKLDELALSGKEFMYETCEKANAAVNELRIKKQLNSVGTTVAAVYFLHDEVVACNMGDSKIFRVRDKKMLQISEDHTDEKIMSAMGIKKKPVLLQYIGVPDTEMYIEPYISKGDIQSKDIYVLCSDGITDVLDINEMYEIICNNSVEEAVRQLLAEVNKKDGADNATVIVIKIA